MHIFAEKLYFIDDDLYRYRRDHIGSSINNKANVFIICDEYDFIYDELCKNPQKKDKFLAAYWYRKYVSYEFTLRRVAYAYKYDFLKRFANELKIANEKGELQLDYLSKHQTTTALSILNDYVLHYRKFIYNENEELKNKDSEKSDITL